MPHGVFVAKNEPAAAAAVVADTAGRGTWESPTKGQQLLTTRAPAAERTPLPPSTDTLDTLDTRQHPDVGVTRPPAPNPSGRQANVLEAQVDVLSQPQAESNERKHVNIEVVSLNQVRGPACTRADVAVGGCCTSCCP